MKKAIKIQIEIPNNWLDANKLDDLSFITRICREEVANQLAKVITTKTLSEMEIPKFKITKQELRRAVVGKLAERALYEDEN